MAVPKTPGADWHVDYSLHLKLGAVLALGMLLGAASFDVYVPERFPDDPPPPEVVTLKEVKQTQHTQSAPPPPAPRVPVEVPNDALVDQPDLPLNSDLILDDVNPDLNPPRANEPVDDEPEVFVAVEQQPKIRGGLQALYDNVSYPQSARRAGVEGRVIVQFVVHEDGTVHDARVVQNVHPLLDREALQAVRDLEFEPGRQRGTAVRVRMTLPVQFRLQ